MKLPKLRSSRQAALLLIAALVVLVITAMLRPQLAAGQAVLIAVVTVLYLLLGSGVLPGMQKQLDSAGRRLDPGSVSFLDSPLAVAAMRRGGTLVWYNEAFRDMTGSTVVPGQDIRDGVAELSSQKFKPEDLLQGVVLPHRSRTYRVYGSPLREQGQTADLVLLLFFDVTEQKALEAEYESSRPVVAQIVIDNLDEISQNARESERAIALAQVDNILADWAAPAGGILQLSERGRYLFVFEERFLQGFVNDKFSVLDSVRSAVADGSLAAPTISIGVGLGGITLDENMELAKQALEMALGRGGDQATVKQGANLEFFGGKSKTVERRTKVKARVMAKQLSDLMEEATSVLVMGHRFADFDSVGSCVGIARLAMVKERPVHIVINRETAPALSLIEHVECMPEYEGVFVSPMQGLDLISSDTLLVICDTHNPEIIESKEIYNNASKVVLIDHHRRMAHSIEDTVLSYHEPYASSASELVCELAQYVAGGNAIRKREAEAMLAGIVLDTNNFAFKTSFRTFEAAAFLRKMGADTVEVKKLFQVDLDSYTFRTDLIRSAAIFMQVTAIAIYPEETDSSFQVVAAMAADEMLDIEGVEASFALYSENGRVHISARSLGGINVQLIMEELGGGGHMTNAGTQLTSTLEEAADRLRGVIHRYVRNNMDEL